MEYAILINILLVLLLIGGVCLTLVSLPGNFVIFTIAVVYGFYDHFTHLTYTVLGTLFVTLLVGEGVEFAAGALGAKREQASKEVIFAAFLGTVAGGIIGSAIIPILGSMAGVLGGAFLASFLAEYLKTGDRERAGRVAQSVLKGQAVGIIAKFAIAVFMVIFILYQLPWQ